MLAHPGLTLKMSLVKEKGVRKKGLVMPSSVKGQHHSSFQAPMEVECPSSLLYLLYQQ